MIYPTSANDSATTKFCCATGCLDSWTRFQSPIPKIQSNPIQFTHSPAQSSPVQHPAYIHIHQGRLLGTSARHITHHLSLLHCALFCLLACYYSCSCFCCCFCCCVLLSLYPPFPFPFFFLTKREKERLLHTTNLSVPHFLSYPIPSI